jgi:hypothetical protein
MMALIKLVPSYSGYHSGRAAPVVFGRGWRGGIYCGASGNDFTKLTGSIFKMLILRKLRIADSQRGNSHNRKLVCTQDFITNLNSHMYHPQLV